MSDDMKFIVRPKVRFCQTDTSEPVAGESKHSVDQKSVKQSNKPKIRSIVTLDKPVKLLTFNNNAREDRDFKIIDDTQNNDLLTLCTNTPLCTVDENPVKITNQKPLSDNKNVKNIKASSKDIVTKISNKPPCDKIVPLLSSDAQDKSLNKPLKPQTCVKANSSKIDVKSKKGKENETLNLKKNNKNSKKIFTSSEITKHKTKPCSAVTNTRKANITSQFSIASKRNLNPKLNVMPCHKYLKIASKAKTSPVKKTVIRDIIGPKIKPCIGPGVLHKKQNNLKTPESSKSALIKSSISGEKLARPEYNSIMCTINKLNELQKQKIVTDMEHLPASYKHFINGKISNALNFSLDEAIYKNLVDLSVDEKQLPGILIRSKDPEPRQKDAVPELSDLFIPVPTEEYCTSVSSRSPAPEMTETWNAFRISNKIFEWKRLLDNI